jgi:hypothetical protein
MVIAKPEPVFYISLSSYQVLDYFSFRLQMLKVVLVCLLYISFNLIVNKILKSNQIQGIVK